MSEAAPLGRRLNAKHPRMAKLTDRDRDLLGLLVLARYLTASQVHRLAFGGKSLSIAYRRLLKLSRAAGQPAFVRQRFFRTYDGNRIAVWAPTPYALPAAVARSAPLPELPKHDVGAQFLEHLIQLNELLILLWCNGNRCPRAAHPFFRWVPSDTVRLRWNEWEIHQGRKQQRVIQPDAVLELPAHRRRYFLECEMGTHTISPREGDAPGSTLSKAERYHTFLSDTSALDGRKTHYQSQYQDTFAPEVIFLVRTEGRASSVNAALAAWRAKSGHNRPSAIRALTFHAAATELRRLAGLAPLAAVASSSPATWAAPPHLSGTEVKLLQGCLNDAIRSIKRARAVFRELHRPELPEYPPTYEQAWALLGRLASTAAQ
jgi:hypothetical protein